MRSRTPFPPPFLITVLSFTVASCVLYQPRELLLKVPDFYEFKIFKDGLYWIADPYVTPGKMEYLFDRDLTKSGIYTVHLILQNWGEGSFDLSQGRTRLVDPEGRGFEPMSREAVTKKVMRNTLGRTFGFGALGTLGVFVLSVPFAMGAGLDSYLSNRRIRRDVAAKEFEADEIGPKEILEGFLFFQIADKKKEIARLGPFSSQTYTLRIEGIRNLATGEAFDTEIVIQGA